MKLKAIQLFAVLMIIAPLAETSTNKSVIQIRNFKDSDSISDKTSIIVTPDEFSR